VILGNLNVVLMKYVKIYLAFESAECVLLIRRKVHSMSNTMYMNVNFVENES